ncbi:DUF1697 domain-containing protein [Microcella sp.]|uniref:DUF1697 domain-containing protein n=1 Tax=Microcella sp. TaxID=1913979 RepID=UPI00391A2478
MRHAFLFRAVNVGGTAKLPMAELRALAAELGATDVQIYIASGNLVAVPPGDPAAFAVQLADAVETRFGFRREVIVRDAAALRAARDAHPFVIVDPAFSYLVPLTSAPVDPTAAADVPSGDDEWSLIGVDLHVRYAKGAGRAELDLTRLLRALGVVGTARNLRTIDALLALLDRQPVTEP